MLYALGQHCDLWEKPLIGRASHNLMRISLAPAIWTDHSHCRTKKLDKMPAGASDRKKIDVIRNVAQDLECGVVLEQKIHLYANAANVLEHVAELHVFRVRSETVESVTCQLHSSEASEYKTYISWSSIVKTCGICANASRKCG